MKRLWRQSSNKKIQNAQPTGKFKSKLEARTEFLLKHAGFKPRYEPKKIVVWEGFRPTVPFYDNGKQRMEKIQDITYTPDFYFKYAGKDIYIETKGIENDVFPIKKKLFRAWLEGQDAMFFEVHNEHDLILAIETIKDEKY